jgi:hypothetical protein
MLFVTSHFYSWGKAYGTEKAMRLLQVELQTPNIGSPEAIKTIARLRTIDDCNVCLDTGSTSIARARSRVAHNALEADCEVWVAIDDDCEATSLTLRWALEACRTSRGICLIPYLARRGDEPERATALVTIEPNAMNQRRELTNGGAVVPCKWGGFGLTFIHRDALHAIADANSHHTWVDEDGIEKLALFQEIIQNRFWYGEDISFFIRTPACVQIEALVTGDSIHNGYGLRLEHIEAYQRGLHDQLPTTIRSGGNDEGTTTKIEA